MEYVILGNGIAGVCAAETIRQFDPKGDITMVADETLPPYSRPMISMVLAGHSERRQGLGESDARVAAKFLRAILDAEPTTWAPSARAMSHPCDGHDGIIEKPESKGARSNAPTATPAVASTFLAVTAALELRLPQLTKLPARLLPGMLKGEDELVVIGGVYEVGMRTL